MLKHTKLDENKATLEFAVLKSLELFQHQVIVDLNASFFAAHTLSKGKATAGFRSETMVTELTSIVVLASQCCGFLPHASAPTDHGRCTSSAQARYNGPIGKDGLCKNCITYESFNDFGKEKAAGVTQIQYLFRIDEYTE